jgi:preprotein translocase subunit SecD
VKYLLDVAKVGSTDVSRATAVNEPDNGGWQVRLGFTGAGRSRWTALTREAYDNGAAHQVGIVVDNVVISAPAISGVITGDAVIAGSFTRDDAMLLADQITFGSLPIGLAVESVRNTP